MKYRIKQIEKNQFIPQVKKWFFGSWKSIDKEDFYLWTNKSYVRFCICSTYGEAIGVINEYEFYLSNQTVITAAKEMFYPKYHKL